MDRKEKVMTTGLWFVFALGLIGWLLYHSDAHAQTRAEKSVDLFSCLKPMTCREMVAVPGATSMAIIRNYEGTEAYLFQPEGELEIVGASVRDRRTLKIAFDEYRDEVWPGICTVVHRTTSLYDRGLRGRVAAAIVHVGPNAEPVEVHPGEEGFEEYWNTIFERALDIGWELMVPEKERVRT